jgi:hypothetical protein
VRSDPTRLLLRRIGPLGLVLVFLSPPGLQAQSLPATGGFVEPANSPAFRAPLTAAEAGAILPTRGVFTFPSPYGTTGFRLTNGDDCGGQDCVKPVGYSYWNNINNHAGSDTMLVFLGLDRNKGGTGPTLFSVDKRTGETRNAGPLFPSTSSYSYHSGEGWYFSYTRPYSLYMHSGRRLLRYDVQTRTFQTVFDVTAQFGTNRYVWQAHSSADDRVHSATLRDSTTYAYLGCIAFREDLQQFYFAPRIGNYDECQIDRSGRWLVIKENVDARNGEDNRIIDLETLTERVLLDENGAAGHSDLGFGYMVSADNWNPKPGAARTWRFDLDVQGGEPVASVPGQGTLVYHLTSWAAAVGHFAHGNARAGVPLEDQLVCSSSASRQLVPRVNEIVCYRLDGSRDTLVVAPNLTNLDATGGGTDDYNQLPKGNIDPTGQYFIWTTNAGSGRLDAYVVRVPGQLLFPEPPPPPPPPVDCAGTWSAWAPTSEWSACVNGTQTRTESRTFTITTPPANGGAACPASPETRTVSKACVVQPPPPPPPAAWEPVRWLEPVNVTVTGSSLQKTSGCNRCADAGAVSEQRIAAGNGAVQFTATESSTSRAIGLSTGNTGAGPDEIRFGIRLQSGKAEIRESGLARGNVKFVTGDNFEIRLENGVIRYFKNGTVIYTSTGVPQYPLLVDTSLSSMGATLGNVMIKLGS